MDEITIGDKVYVSSKRAAAITGYAKDYVGQLCREGRVEARLVGRNWYVLESAIREHRFGAEEGHPIQEEKATEQPERHSTWDRPQYEAEEPAFVPPLAPKRPHETMQAPAIADMQSAWREWFEEKRPQVAAQEEESEAESQNLEEPAPHAQYFEEEEAVVAIERIPEDLPREENEDTEAKYEDEVSVHRSYRSYRAEDYVPTAIPVAVETLQRSGRANEEAEGGEWNGVIRALLLVVMLLAVLVAIVGTGHSERVFSGTSLNFGAQKTILDYLGGTRTYDNSL